jgi:hypothetical protein
MLVPVAIVIAWIAITAIPSVDAALGWLIIAIADQFHKASESYAKKPALSSRSSVTVPSEDAKPIRKRLAQQSAA